MRVAFSAPLNRSPETFLRRGEFTFRYSSSILRPYQLLEAGLRTFGALQLGGAFACAKFCVGQ
jgi:hypothetical protein